MLAAATFLVISAFGMGLRRRAVLTGAEVALYWLGSAIAVAFAIAVLFAQKNWSWLGTGLAFFSGWLAGALPATLSGVTLLVVWRRRSAGLKLPSNTLI
jgi:hypothetical protein